MKYLVRITETAVKTHEATIEAASKEAAEAKVDQVNQTVSKSWDSVSVKFQVVKQLDGPWCEVKYERDRLMDVAIIRVIPRFGNVFTTEERKLLQSRVQREFGVDCGWGPHEVAFEFRRRLTEAECAALTAPPRTKSVSDVLAGAKV